MTLHDVIILALKASIVLSVLAVGLRSTPERITYLFRHPDKLLRSLIAMDAAMPLFALGVVLFTSVPAPVKIALVALSIAPVPPIFSRKVDKASHAEDYAVGLLFGSALIACVFMPAALALLGRVSGVEAYVSFATVATVMATTVLAPLVAGVLARRFWPELAERVAQPLATFAIVLLVISAVPVLFVAAPQAWSLVGDGSIAVFAVFVLLGLVVGHFLGGPNANERTVLAMATATRHPGVAIAVVGASFPDEKLAIAAVALYLLVNAIFGAPYSMWRKRLQKDDGATTSDVGRSPRELRATNKDKPLDRDERPVRNVPKD